MVKQYQVIDLKLFCMNGLFRKMFIYLYKIEFFKQLIFLTLSYMRYNSFLWTSIANNHQILFQDLNKKANELDLKWKI